MTAATEKPTPSAGSLWLANFAIPYSQDDATVALAERETVKPAARKPAKKAKRAA